MALPWAYQANQTATQAEAEQVYTLFSLVSMAPAGHVAHLLRMLVG